MSFSWQCHRVYQINHAVLVDAAPALQNDMNSIMMLAISYSSQNKGFLVAKFHEEAGNEQEPMFFVVYWL